jgi:VWFA-related protein
MNMRRISASAFALAATLWLPPAFADQDGQKPRFVSTTDYVTTEVFVRDGRGVFVQDLTVKDFVLLEDGVQQTLTTFVRVKGGRATTQLFSAAPAREGLILPPVKEDDPGRVFAIFIDDRHIQPSDSLRTRSLLQKIRDTLLHDGDLVTMVSTGPSAIEERLNYDIGHARFDRVTGRILASGMTPAEIIAANQTSEGPAGLRHDAHVAFRTAHDLLGELAKIKDRRKAFLYVSSGYDFNPYVDSRFKAMQNSAGSANPFDSGGQQFSESDLIAELVVLANAAQRANVTFYTIDPRGLIAGPSINTSISVQDFHDQVAKSTTSLKTIAEETGGFCLCNTNDFTKGLRRIDEAMSDYYLIGYTSSNADQSKLRRTISVRVTRPAVTVSGFRSEYTIKR